MIRYCIFDLDGTLLDTIRSITHYLNETLKEEELLTITEEECRAFIGDGAAKLVERAVRKSGNVSQLRYGRVLEKYNSRYDASPEYLTEPYEGMIPLLDLLAHRGITLGVISNKPDATTVSLVRHFFGDRFSFVVGGKRGEPLKPAPDTTLAMLRDMGGDPSELAFIGDSPQDIATGKNAGAALTVGVLWGFRSREDLLLAGADVLVDAPSDIASAIGVTA